ncbi:MAG: hypothetical protein DYG92_14005 [Leptolyngbya sp. PLA1]|nr:hypothetical protein [Leptolyngbya sp. PLA1]
MDRLSRSCALAALAGSLLAGHAGAAIIDSSSYFTSLPHTLIDFELDANGDPLGLIDGESLEMPLTAYSTQGVTFTQQARWVNDGSPAFDAAQLIGGSWDHSIPSAFVNSFAFTFDVPVRAFGFWVVNNQNLDPDGPVFRAYDAQNQLIEQVQFTGTVVDSTITDGVTVAGYGFMGIEADRDIARVEVQKRAAIFDDLRFSAVPAPGTAALGGLAGLLLSRRRRAS